mgnify:FL=1
MLEIALLFLLLLGAWFWQDSVSKREIAIKIGRELAGRYQLQLLDETVACNKLSLGRDSLGNAQLMRDYAFEVSANGAERLQCNLQLKGRILQNWHIPPYIQPDL